MISKRADAFMRIIEEASSQNLKYINEFKKKGFPLYQEIKV
jgi:hypothetical protein